MHTPVRPLVGAVFGLLLTVPALAQFSISLGNAGFESAVSAGIPSTAGIWAGDLNTAVTAENGVTPYAGSQMLSFLKNAPDGATNGSGSDSVQLVDLSAYSASIATGGFTVTLSAYYNRADSAYSNFQTFIRSYSGSILNFPTDHGTNYTAVQTGDLFADTNPATWELGTVSMTLPTNTTYIAVWVSLLHNNNTPSVTPGYYADNVTLTAVPEPSTYAAMVGLVALGWAARRRGRTSA